MFKALLLGLALVGPGTFEGHTTYRQVWLVTLYLPDGNTRTWYADVHPYPSGHTDTLTFVHQNEYVTIHGTYVLESKWIEQKP